MLKQSTEDGSTTFYNEEFAESYHSKIGAYREALEKHVQACNIQKLAKEQKQLKLLDVCFGLGYNSFAAISEAIKINPQIHIEITALENDLRILEEIKKIDMPNELKDIQEAFNIPETIEENFKIEILLGDARQEILKCQENYFDAIFFDPFSPKSCPQLWQEAFIRDVVQTAKSGAYISTYSSSRIAKDNFKNAGCEISQGPLCGRRTGGVLAKKN